MEQQEYSEQQLPIIQINPALGVAGGVGDKYIIQAGTASTYPYSIGFETNSLWMSSPNTIKLYNNGSNSILIISSGNVGIGTTDPKELLDVRRKGIFHNGIGTTPTNGTYGSGGTRLILWPGTDTNTPYSLGIAGGTLWYLVPTSAIHAFYVGTTERMRINASGFVGINTNDPKCQLQVNGICNINNGSPVAVPLNYMQSGSLTIGGTNANYGGGNLWNANTAGLLMECADNTEIAVHDNGLRVASFMYYEGGANNRIIIGRDMGWGAISSVNMRGNTNINGDLTLTGTSAKIFLPSTLY
jgi:hypothetical protein